MSSALISLPPARSWDEPSGARRPPSSEGIPRRPRPAAREGSSTRGQAERERARAGAPRNALHAAQGSRQLLVLLRAEAPNFLQHRICPRRSPRPPRGAPAAARRAGPGSPRVPGEVPEAPPALTITTARAGSAGVPRRPRSRSAPAPARPRAPT